MTPTIAKRCKVVKLLLRKWMFSMSPLLETPRLGVISLCTCLHNSSCGKTKLLAIATSKWMWQLTAQTTPTFSASLSLGNIKSWWTTQAIKSAFLITMQFHLLRSSISTQKRTPVMLQLQPLMLTLRTSIIIQESRSVLLTPCRLVEMWRLTSRGGWPLYPRKIAPLVEQPGLIKMTLRYY